MNSLFSLAPGKTAARGHVRGSWCLLLESFRRQVPDEPKVLRLAFRSSAARASAVLACSFHFLGGMGWGRWRPMAGAARHGRQLVLDFGWREDHQLFRQARESNGLQSPTEKQIFFFLYAE